MSRLHHTFAVEHAEQYGIECAILIHHFQFWIEQNQAMGKNFIDGRTWTYQTHKEIYAIYPYLSEDIVQRNLKKLVDEGVLVTANYNKSQLNKTLWYAFKNEKMFTKPQNCGMETAKLRNASRENAEYIRKDAKSTYTKKDHHQPPPKSSKEKPSEIDDDDFVFSAKEREQLNNFTPQQIQEAQQITNKECIQKTNNARVKYFFKTLLSRSLKTKTLSPYEELKTHFKNLNEYNSATCYIDSQSIAFERGMRNEAMKFQYFSWDKFQKLCDSFGIKFKRSK